MSDKLDQFLKRAEGMLERLEQVLPEAQQEIDWSAPAQRWQHDGSRGRLEAIHSPRTLSLDDLLCIDRQKSELLRNTQNFVNGKAANNALLWGSRGTGKSSLVKALLPEFREQGLRLLEVDKDHLVELPRILELINARDEHFIIFSDDLSFEAQESSYKPLKAALDGSLAGLPENILIYATSNRRHLLPEYQSENQHSKIVDEELHLAESLEEKISLSERFGLWLSFRPFSQDNYLDAVAHWLQAYGSELNDESRREALRFALQRGSRSGRVARQFAIDFSNR
ncbi:ATP-binding protein [Solemya elarraichensis gill symbiont]|uniref:AAA family ATPase n=1 Tax=Solemya elarraichensis gill symbiont TaxID=1918949 RepID=A0A1T2LCR9_9GAMM|nr:ATP-binding protein [Solemya elarraichensis gill symbiont]OOZ42895.1 AAA family ATPase [Solemya elarraichensis gill symbiont]